MAETKRFLKYLCDYYKCNLVIIDQWHIVDEWISYCTPSQQRYLKTFNSRFSNVKLKHGKGLYPKQRRFLAALCKDQKIWLCGLDLPNPIVALDSLKRAYVGKIDYRRQLWNDRYKRSTKEHKRILHEDHLDGICVSQLKLFDVLRNG